MTTVTSGSISQQEQILKKEKKWKDCRECE